MAAKTDSGERPSISVAALLREMDRRYEERFAAQEKAVAAALASAKEAVIKAEGAAEKRFEALNELRGAVQDILGKTLPRSEAESEFRRIGEKQDEHAEQDRLQHADLMRRLEANTAILTKMTPLELHFELDKRITQIASQRGGEKDSQASLRANISLAISIALFLATIVLWGAKVMTQAVLK